jgi:KTSC domain
MQHRPIESSHLKSAGYDPINKILEVKFQNNAVYRYRGVSPEDHQGLLSCPSAGQFLQHRIKDVYDCEKIK